MVDRPNYYFSLFLINLDWVEDGAPLSPQPRKD